jgi:ATP-dependent RNA helicase RhlE
VFVRTKRGADRLVKKLGQRNVKALAMHGDKTQGQRQKALARFERGDLMTLVATDVAARGIDVNEVTDVINFDIPEDRETYTHRTGRTGRAGAEGRALTFVLADQRADVRAIARELDLTTELEHAIGGGGHGGHIKHGRPNGNGNGRPKHNGHTTPKPKHGGKPKHKQGGHGKSSGKPKHGQGSGKKSGSSHGGRKHKPRGGSGQGLTQGSGNRKRRNRAAGASGRTSSR